MAPAALRPGQTRGGPVGAGCFATYATGLRATAGRGRREVSAVRGLRREGGDRGGLPNRNIPPGRSIAVIRRDHQGNSTPRDPDRAVLVYEQGHRIRTTQWQHPGVKNTEGGPRHSAADAQPSLPMLRCRTPESAWPERSEISVGNNAKAPLRRVSAFQKPRPKAGVLRLGRRGMAGRFNFGGFGNASVWRR